MAECNHFSCLTCWVKWLRRSQTCPTCRNPTNTDTLSRVVFEAEVGAGAPSLTQIMKGDYESQDEEERKDDDSDTELEVLSKSSKDDK